MKQLQVSGVYPHLAVTHNELNDPANECGIGAVVAYGDKLYWISYPASAERGGLGRLYCMGTDGVRVECPESTGGTHANRMIHSPSGALIMGANVIFPNGEIRAFDVKKLVGRLTGAGVHPRAEEGWAYIASMEDGLYEVNIHTMEVRTLRKDVIDRLRIGGVRPKNHRAPQKIDGDHGKGFYAAQGVLLYANNGHIGVLAEWNGEGDPQDKTNWKTIERTNFTEITGPGGIYGPQSADDPIWTLGWDSRSVLLCVRSDSEWMRYRLPKASYTQDADHGWFTEWPRIRKVCGKYLLCMHGMIYEFPENFRKGCAGGIRPMTRHLKMIADYEEWEDGLVFACDDASCFDNPSLGRCQSNLWFSSLKKLEAMSAPSAWGGWYVHEPVCEDIPSDPLFVGGFDEKVLFFDVKYEMGAVDVEVDRDGSGSWEKLTSVIAGHENPSRLVLPADVQWVRVVPDRDMSVCTVYMYMSMKHDTQEKPELTAGLLSKKEMPGASFGRLVALTGKDMKLGYLSNAGYYEADGELHWQRAEVPDFVKEVTKESKPNWLEPRLYQTGHSVLVITPEGKRYQLPWLPEQKDARMFVREVVTERSLICAGGSIFELPRPESGGAARMKPVTTHGCALEDFVSWRGLLVMSGVDLNAQGEHIFRTEDGKAAVWCGVVDDLWSLGAPRGEGGPLCNTALLAGEGSDPFLLAGYRHKKLSLSHDQSDPVVFTLDTDFAGIGDFVPEKTFTVNPGETLEVILEDEFAAHWVRFRTDKTCKATALFKLWC